MRKETKPKTYVEVQKMFGDETMPKTLDDVLDEKIDGLVKKSEKSGIPYGILKQVYNRGMGSWRTGHRFSLTLNSGRLLELTHLLPNLKELGADADKDLAAKAEVDSKNQKHMNKEQMNMQIIHKRVTMDQSKMKVFGQTS